MADGIALDAVKAKIRALLAKTVANGCTEGEAIAAAAKAFELMGEHRITHEALDMTSTSSPLGRSRRQVLDDLWGPVGYVCRCSAMQVRNAEGHLSIQYHGRDPWPEVATWLRGTLEAAHTRAVTAYRVTPEYKRRRTTKTRAAARRTFTAGFVDAVRVKLFRLIQDREEHRLELAKVKAAMACMFPNTHSVAPLGPGKVQRNTERDHAAGAAAGRETAVNWAMRGGASGSIGQAPRLLATSSSRPGSGGRS